MMSIEDTGRFTVGVFQDAAWAQKGLDALARAGFPKESLTILAKEGADASSLIQKTLGTAGERLQIAGVGPVVVHGPLLDALQGKTRDLDKLGLAGTMRRVGF